MHHLVVATGRLAAAVPGQSSLVPESVEASLVLKSVVVGLGPGSAWEDPWGGSGSVGAGPELGRDGNLVLRDHPGGWDHMI